jgi:hypothetical protein
VTPARFLFDTSALVRLFRDDGVRTGWQPHVTAGVVGVCPITELELLYSARSKDDRQERLDLLNAAFTWVPVPDRVFDRAAEVQDALTSRGTHRSAGVVDLLVAATAELAGLVLVHHDHDFDAITEVTSQPAAWVAPPGAVS